jgi:hypothetical protein
MYRHRPNSANRPSTKARKPISALAPEMGSMLIWPGFSSVTCPLLSYSLVIGKHPQNALISLLVHSSRFDRHGITGPLKPGAQFLHTTGRAVPPMAHGGLIGDASTFAAAEEPESLSSPPAPGALWQVAGAV